MRAIETLLIGHSAEHASLLAGSLAGGTPPLEVVHVPGLGEGLALLGRRRFGAVLLDLALSDAGGSDALARLHEAAPAVPVVVVAGDADEARALAALHRGARDYLLATELAGPASRRAVGRAIALQRVLDRIHRMRRLLAWRLEPGADPLGEGASEAATLPGARILVVDDAADLRALVTVQLRRAGAAVEEADDGHTAIEAVRAAELAGAPFDAVLMDVSMPVLDGPDAVRMLRAGGWVGPVVALTGHRGHEERARCIDAGFDDVVAKPIATRGLLAVLRIQLGPAERRSEAAPPAAAGRS